MRPEVANGLSSVVERQDRLADLLTLLMSLPEHENDVARSGL